MLSLHRIPRTRPGTGSPLPFVAQLPPGKLVEISGDRSCARLSTAVSAVWHAQVEGETTVWIQPAGGTLFPPDLHECGIDLSALPVIQVPPHAGIHAPFKAAELLLRSGAFGLIVMDLRDDPARFDAAVQGRILGLAREHSSRVVLITKKSRASDSLGPLVSVRFEPRRRRIGRNTFAIEHEVLKNKQGLGFVHECEVRRGPRGLR